MTNLTCVLKTFEATSDTIEEVEKQVEQYISSQADQTLHDSFKVSKTSAFMREENSKPMFAYSITVELLKRLKNHDVSWFFIVKIL